MECVIIPALTLALVALIWLAVRPFLVAAGWRRLADDLNLDYSPASGPLGIPHPGQIEGNYRGRKVQISLFVETIPHSDGTYQLRYLRLTLALNNPHRRRLVVQKRWPTHITRPGQSVHLPDRSFSDRYAIIVSEPQDFALKVFHDEGLRQRFHASLGSRGTFCLHLEGPDLQLGTRMISWLPPDSGIEWRRPVLKAILDVAVDVAEAAEAAPAAPWSPEYMHEGPEAGEPPNMSAP